MANRADGRVLPEWAQHDACWLAYPHLEAEWGAAFEGARADIAALCRAIATHGGERVELLVRDAGTEAHARAANDLAVAVWRQGRGAEADGQPVFRAHPR